ncbi:cystein proteinase inhibitor protein salarin-like [Conger conger]|uniref:cystein proteinase inhibitor protein salarin-like n=1 Tax=Conger conger TaxID=82655 RepID=UPI002A59E8A8|nr:cystein proteinase inhibitor protein salarin-like [Conger conger]
MAQQCVIKPMLEVELYDNNDGNVETDWKEWKKKHGKCYSPEEDARRKQAWLKTRVTVTEHNRLYMAGKVTSTQGVNHFAADLEGEGPAMGLIMPSEEEMKRLEAEQNLVGFL